MVLRSSASTVHRSPALNVVPSLVYVPPFQSLFALSPPASLSPSGRRSHTELAQGSSGTNEVQHQRVSSSILYKDQIASSLRNANQSVCGVGQEFHFTKVEKREIVAVLDLQASKIGIFKAEKDSLNVFLADQDDRCETF